MADRFVPLFHIDRGVPVIEIGAREFKCVGALPPFAWWLSGRDSIRRVLVASGASGASGAPCDGSHLVRTGDANGLPAYGQYRETEPFALVLLETGGGLITGVTTYLEPRLFPLFGLPMSSSAPLRT